MRSLAFFSIGVLGSALARAANPGLDFLGTLPFIVIYALALFFAYRYALDRIEANR